MMKEMMNEMSVNVNEIVNLTPHDVNIVAEGGAVIATFPSAGNARASQKEAPITTLLNGVELVRMEFGATVDLPEPREGVLLVVSTITVSAARAEGRTVDDLVIPASPVRDGDGQIIGCRKLAFPA